VIVTGDRVCLRSRADAQSEVVHQVSTGDSLLADLTTTGRWVQVKAPAAAEVWISADLVSNGVVRAAKGVIRAGPSRNYPAIGMVVSGDSLNVRQARYGWLQIVPPDGCRLWIHRDYVRQPAPRTAAQPPKALPAQTAPSAQGELASRGVSTPAVTNEPPAKSAIVSVPPIPGAPAEGTRKAIAGTAGGSSSLPPALVPPLAPPVSGTNEARDPGRLPDSKQQGRNAVYRGVLERCTWFWRPAPYRLMVDDPRRGRRVLCYVSRIPDGAGRLEGKLVEATGRESETRRGDRPVMSADTVRECQTE
jgi:hypothetical protein